MRCNDSCLIFQVICNHILHNETANVHIQSTNRVVQQYNIFIGIESPSDIESNLLAPGQIEPFLTQ